MSKLDCKCFKCGTEEELSYSAYINTETHKKEWICWKCNYENEQANVLDDKYVKSRIFEEILKEIEYNNPKIARKEIEGTYITLEMKDEEILKRAKTYKKTK